MFACLQGLVADPPRRGLPVKKAGDNSDDPSLHPGWFHNLGFRPASQPASWRFVTIDSYPGLGEGETGEAIKSLMLMLMPMLQRCALLFAVCNVGHM